MKRFPRDRPLSFILFAVAVPTMTWTMAHSLFPGTPGGMVGSLLFVNGPYLLFLMVPGKPWLSFLTMLGIFIWAAAFWFTDDLTFGPVSLLAGAAASYFVALISLTYHAVRGVVVDNPPDHP